MSRFFFFFFFHMLWRAWVSQAVSSAEGAEVPISSRPCTGKLARGGRIQGFASLCPVPSDNNADCQAQAHQSPFALLLHQGSGPAKRVAHVCLPCGEGRTRGPLCLRYPAIEALHMTAAGRARAILS